MQTIYKYSLVIRDEPQEVSMPIGSLILHVDAQKEVPCIWALVNTEASHVKRFFRVYGTGHPIGRGAHVGSFQMPPFVWHIFEHTHETSS